MEKILVQQKSDLNLKNIGARFRSVRSLININRKTFCERHEINRYTMQSWENGLHISKGKNIEKFIEALSKEGILCNEDWLLYGRGDPPKTLGEINHSPKNFSSGVSKGITGLNSDLEIAKNIKDLYEKKQMEALVFRLLDDHMSPKFSQGDLVIGIKASSNSLIIHQKDCIIDLGLDRLLVRRTLAFKDRIMLLALDQTQPTFILGQDAKIYPIVWHFIGK